MIVAMTRAVALVPSRVRSGSPSPGGSPTCGGRSDNSNAPAPSGIAVDNEGNVYVSDYALTEW